MNLSKKKKLLKIITHSPTQYNAQLTEWSKENYIFKYSVEKV